MSNTACAPRGTISLEYHHGCHIHEFASLSLGMASMSLTFRFLDGKPFLPGMVRAANSKPDEGVGTRHLLSRPPLLWQGDVP